MSEILTPLTFICDACGGNGDFFGPLGDDRCPKCGGNAHVARALRAENARLRNACKATLMFYRSGHWDEEAANEWRNLTGSQDATTRVLCDTVRRALAAPPEEK